MFLDSPFSLWSVIFIYLYGGMAKRVMVGEGRIEDPSSATGQEGAGEPSYQEQVLHWCRLG